MFRAARVASRASKNSWSFEVFTCFQFTAEHGSSYRSTTICPAVQNMGKIDGLLGHKTRRQAKRIYFFFLQILPLERNTCQRHRILLFYMEKARPLAKFRSYLAEISLEREVWSLFSIFPLPPHSLFPYIRTSEYVHSVSHVVVGADTPRWEPCKFSVPTLSMVILCTNQTACMAFLSSMHLLFLKLCPSIKLRFPAFPYSLCEDRQLSASYSSLGGRLVNRWKKKPRGETLFKKAVTKKSGYWYFRASLFDLNIVV